MVVKGRLRLCGRGVLVALRMLRAVDCTMYRSDRGIGIAVANERGSHLHRLLFCAFWSLSRYLNVLCGHVD